MRIALLATLLLCAPRALATPPLVGLEARLGGGAAFGGGAGGSTWRLAPVQLDIQAEVALSRQPSLSLYGAGRIEGVDRIGGALGLGFRLRPLTGPLRFSIGALAYVAPYTLLGANVAAGACLAVGKAVKIRLCADLETTLFFAGSDLPSNRVAGQFLVLTGVGFDAL